MPKPKAKILDGDRILFDGGFMSSKPLAWREKRVCIMCGAEYEPNSPTQKTCGKECATKLRIEYRHKKNKEYWAANKERINAERADKTRPHEVRPPRGASHNITPKEKVEMERKRKNRQQNMRDIERIAALSNGDYGKWVAFNDR